MGLDHNQFRDLILVPTLKALEPEVKYSDKADIITDETIWHESAGLTCIAQKLNAGSYGAGRGIGMTERPTYNWLWGRYAKILIEKEIAIKGTFEELHGNWELAVAMCRLRYFVRPEPLPAISEGVEARAAYWGRFYQTSNDPKKIALYIQHARSIPHIGPTGVVV